MHTFLFAFVILGCFGAASNVTVAEPPQPDCDVGVGLRWIALPIPIGPTEGHVPFLTPHVHCND